MSAKRLQRVACKLIGCRENAAARLTSVPQPGSVKAEPVSQLCPTLGWIHLTDEVHNEPKGSEIPILLRR